jgi:hypothetical protein
MVAHYRATAVTDVGRNLSVWWTWWKLVYMKLMRLFRVHIQAVQVSLLLTLPVYIPCAPKGDRC